MFTLLYYRINTVVLAELSLHHNINIDRQDHCTVRQTNAKNDIPGSITTSLLSHAKVELTTLLLVHFPRTSKSVVYRLFTYVQHFCWFVENEPANMLYIDFLHVCNTFAGSSKMNQQICCISTFCICATLLLVRQK